MKSYCAILLVIIAITGFSQGTPDNRLDSLTSQLDRALTNGQRTDLLNSLALAYYNIDLKKSLAFGEDAMGLATLTQNDEGVQQALTILMRVHRRLGNFSVAIELSLQKIRLAEKRGDTPELVDSYSSLGNIYSSLERYKESKEFLMKAYKLGARINVQNLSSIMNFLGRAYAHMNRYDSGEFWIRRAMQRELSVPQEGYTLSYIYNNLADIYYYRKKYYDAIAYYKRSLELPARQKSPFGVTFSLNGLGRVYKEMGDTDKAIEVLLQSLAISKKNAYRDKTKEAYGILHEVYEARNDYKNALSYYKQFNLYQDSIFSDDKVQYIENLKVTYETGRVAQENELLKKDAELTDVRLREQRSIAWGAIIAIVSLSALVVFLYRNYRQKRATNELLAASNQTLEDQVQGRTHDLVKTNLELIRQNNQLEQFGFIIAHNLRAPVARILGLTSIINNPYFSMPEDKVVLERLQLAAVELDAVIHDLNAILDIKKGVHSSYEIVDIAERVEKVKRILKDRISDASAEIIESLEVTRCHAIAAYIESMLYNLISNAIKYRSDDRPLKIHIASRKDGESLVLEIADNGIGIDLEKQKDKVFNLYQRFHSHVEGKGIGLFLVKTQVEALNGRIDISSEVDLGTVFIIYLPLQHTDPSLVVRG